MNRRFHVELAVQEAVDKARRSKAPDNVWVISEESARWAIQTVRRHKLAERIADWQEQDRKARRKHAGGAPVTFSDEALLVIMVLAARPQKPMHGTVFAHGLFRGLPESVRDELGIPEGAALTDELGREAEEQAVRRRLHRIIEAMDPWPLQTYRRLTPSQLQEREVLSHNVFGARHRRLVTFCNLLLHISYLALPRRFRRRWKGSVSIDATKIPAFSKGPEVDKATGDVVLAAVEPDAGWYVRDDESTWAREASLVIMGHDEPLDPRSFPFLIIGMAPLHRPGAQPGLNAIEAIRSLHNRKMPKGLAATDDAYVHSVPENYQLPLQAYGYEMLTSYRDDQLGVQGNVAGALMVEGSFYCPAMPEPVINATRDKRKSRISYERWQELLDARDAYRLKPKEAPDAEGKQRLQCPAAGTCPSAKCAMKPASETKPSARTRIHVTATVKNNPPLVCRQQTITVGPEDAAKLRQRLVYGSEEWRRKYKHLRSNIEGANGYAKDSAFENIADPKRRRMRGTAMQSVLVAFQLMGSNLRKIDGFVSDLAKHVQQANKLIARRPRRSRHTPISAFRSAPLPVGPSP